MPLALKVVTAERTVLSEDIDMLIAPGAAGELGILPHHISLLTTLKPGEMRVLRDGAWESLAVAGGFMQVDPQGVTVLADAAERANEIDEAAAQEARRHAEAAMESAGDDLKARAEAQRALLRALARVSVVQRHKHQR